MAEALAAAPQELSQTGLRKGRLEDLALKILYVSGEMTALELGNHLGLNFPVVDEIVFNLRKDQLCIVKGMTAGGVQRLGLLEAGRARARSLLEISQYTGPAPVSLMDYSLRVRAQRLDETKITPQDLVRAFHSLVLDAEIIARLGAAISSGQALFLYGPAGTGKTSIATMIASIFSDTVWIPYAVEVDNQVITVFDPGVHRPSEQPPSEDEYDRRWVLCNRPCVIGGGELSLEMLDLQPSSMRGFFQAPLQMKANNGVLVVDDFGRQRMQPYELFNRWMTPLDRKVDYLTVPGGRKFEVPFDCLVVFATNLDPRQLSDRAFLRRLPNKIKMDYASPKQFAEIFRRECSTRLLDCKDEMVQHTIEFITKELKQPLSHCYARDVINQAVFFASFLDSDPMLTKDALERACRSYFLETEDV